jgi:hypothetical protein
MVLYCVHESCIANSEQLVSYSSSVKQALVSYLQDHTCMLFEICFLECHKQLLLVSSEKQLSEIVLSYIRPDLSKHVLFYLMFALGLQHQAYT